MNPITLNLATRPFRNNLVVGSIIAGVAAVVVAATAWNGYVYLNYGGHYHALQQEEARHRERLQSLEQEERGLGREIQARDYRRLYGRGQFAAGLITRRSFSWTLLFNKLEAIVPPEVMMTTIRPQFGSEGILVRVDGVARSHDGFIALEEALQKSPVFGRVYPLYERKVNPSRPEISFAVNFEYVPAKAVPGPDAVASAGAPAAGATPAAAAAAPASQTAEQPMARPASPVTQGPGAAPAPAPAAGPPLVAQAVAASGAPASGVSVPGATAPGAPGATASSAGGGPTAAGAEGRPREVLGTVGRDGQPRTADTLARLMAAPGGFYPAAPPTRAPKEPAAPGRKPKEKKGEPRPAPTPGAAAPASGGSKGASSSTAGPVSAATWQDSGPAATGARPALQAGLPPRRDPNLAAPGARGSKASVPRAPEPIPATRLDLSLKFSSRPVGEVYRALAAAHGVRFELDPAVDARIRVSADLGGRTLKDAIALLSKQAGHKVIRVEDGVYRVALAAGGEPLADRPVQEEPLPAGDRP